VENDNYLGMLANRAITATPTTTGTTGAGANSCEHKFSMQPIFSAEAQKTNITGQ
jgi:hypothetical protein